MGDAYRFFYNANVFVEYAIPSIDISYGVLSLYDQAKYVSANLRTPHRHLWLDIFDVCSQVAADCGSCGEKVKT